MPALGLLTLSALVDKGERNHMKWKVAIISLIAFVVINYDVT